MEHRVPRQVDVLAEAAPQMRRALRRGVAVADRIGIVAPVGVFAVAVLAEMAPLALAAGDIVLDEDEIAFLEALAAGELAAGLGDGADVLVAHDHRRRRRRMLVELDVGAADAGDLDLHQRGILRNVRHRIFADLGRARRHPDGGKDLFSQGGLLLFAWVASIPERTSAIWPEHDAGMTRTRCGPR